MSTSCKPMPPEDGLTHDNQVTAAASSLVRSALNPFDSVFNVSSEQWEAVLNARLNLIKLFETERVRILDLLYEVIPTLDPVAKRRMIEAKRHVYNRRSLGIPNLDSAPAELIENLSLYDSLLTGTQADLGCMSEPVIRELRLKLSQLLDDDVFAAAVAYSCPWLPARIRNDLPRSEPRFSNAERGLYSYAVKMFAKANPFHVFAGVGVPGADEAPAGISCEVVLDNSLLMAIETRLLASTPDGVGPYLSFCPCVEVDDRIRCLIATDSALKLLSLAQTPFLNGLLRYFQDDAHIHTRSGALEYLISSGVVPLEKRDNADRDLQVLIGMSIIASYWFRDFDHLQQDCPSSTNADFEAADRLAKIHLSTIPITSVPYFHDKVSNLGGVYLRETENGNPYYLNSYIDSQEDPTWPAGQSLERDLDEIKSLLVVTNFSEESAGIEQWLTECLNGAPNKRLRYIDVINPFLRWSQSDNFNSGTKVRAKPSNRGTLSAAIESFSSYDGQISRPQLLQLGTLLNDSNPSRYKPSDLCVNGTYDGERNHFYLSNAFVGHRRYLSRFRRFRDLPLMQEPASDHHDALDVQLVVPLRHNRDYGLPVWQTGTGFQTRERHRFLRWLNVADLMIELRNDVIQYLDAKSGRVVRLHFSGYILANYLPAAYKLLLVGHGDFCYVPSGPVPYKAVLRDVPYREGLFYGSVCLRRPQWHIQCRSLKQMLTEPNVLKATVELCIRLESSTQTDICNWYFRTAAPGQMTSKPRLLQSRNPLSVQSFLREVSRLPDDGVVTLAAMVPSPETLRSAPTPTVTEVLFKL